MATNSNVRLDAQGDMLGRITYEDLRSPGLFARWPLLGLAMLVLGGLLFGALAYGVEGQNASLLQWDGTVTQAFHAELNRLPVSLVEYVIFGFFLGKEMVIAVGVILAVYFFYKHFWRELAMVWIGLGGGALIWNVLNQYFDRPRPTGQLPVLSLTDPSFPSGLALMAVLCYGLLGYLLVPKLPSRFLKWLAAFAVAFIIVFIGASTLVWGSHYVTDVIAGYALGLAWAGLVYTLMERFFKGETARSQENSSIRVSPTDLRSPGWFRKWPLFAILMVLLSSLTFAALSYNLVSHGPLFQMDRSIYSDLIGEAKSAPPVVNEIMIFGFFLGKQVVLMLVAALCIYFSYKRFWLELTMLLLSSAAGSIFWNFLIDYFARPRPAIQTGLAVTTLPSFPSGHTMNALIVYGFLAYLLIPKMPSLFSKWAVGIMAVAIILFVGLSRVFQGGHYLTDAVGGYVLGIAWAGVIYLLLENLFWRKKA